MPFKKNEAGQLVTDDKGMPIFVGPDGAEKPYDVDARTRQIAELTEKAAKRGKELDDLKAKFAAFAEIEDLAAYIEEHKKNAEIVATMQDKDRQTEENTLKRIQEATKSAVAPVALERDKLKAELEKATNSLNQAVISDSFHRSKWAAEKLSSVALAQQLFAGNFYVKDGKAVGRNADGTDMYGSEGNVATFDEALSRLVESSPFKDNILKSSPGGSGGTANAQGGASSHKDKKFTEMTPEEKAAYLSNDANLKRR